MSLCLGVGLIHAVFLHVLDSSIDAQVARTLDERLAARAGTLIEDLAARRSELVSLPHPVYGEPIYFEVLDRSGRTVATSGFQGTLSLPSGYRVNRPFDVTLPDGHPARAMASYVPAYGSAGVRPGDLVAVVAEDRSKTDELSNAIDFAIWIGFYGPAK